MSLEDPGQPGPPDHRSWMVSACGHPPSVAAPEEPGSWHAGDSHGHCILFHREKSRVTRVTVEKLELGKAETLSHTLTVILSLTLAMYRLYLFVIRNRSVSVFSRLLSHSIHLSFSVLPLRPSLSLSLSLSPSLSLSLPLPLPPSLSLHIKSPPEGGRCVVCGCTIMLRTCKTMDPIGTIYLAAMLVSWLGKPSGIFRKHEN